MITEDRKEVKVYNVYALHTENNCTGTYLPAEDFIQWDDNGTPGDLSDDSFNYKYICDECSDEIISEKKYPHQEFVEI